MIKKKRLLASFKLVCEQCAQIGQFLKSLSNKFSYKSSLNGSLNKNLSGYILGHVWEKLSCFLFYLTSGRTVVGVDNLCTQEANQKILILTNVCGSISIVLSFVPAIQVSSYVQICHQV